MNGCGNALSARTAALRGREIVLADFMQQATGRIRRGAGLAWLVLAAACLALGGCSNAVRFPDAPLAVVGTLPGEHAYDANFDGDADFFEYENGEGRIDRIAYDRNGDAKADFRVALDDLPLDRCRHLVIMLDGFGYDVVKRYYDAGGLRVFHAPSRVVVPYPAMTDIATADLLGDFACRASQAKYFDVPHNRVAGSATGYITYENEAYARLFTYRELKRWDGIAYFWAGPVFKKELSDLKKLFDKRRTREIVATLVSSAAVSTQDGEAGQMAALRRVDQLVNQIIWETHGLVKITLLADHGHSYTPPERLDVESFLKERGWRLAKKLNRPTDYYIERLGLITVACLWTQSPAALAQDLIRCGGVSLASYADGDAAMVLSPDGGRAAIRKRGEAYSYEAAAVDPLLLKPILEQLTANDGYYGGDALLAATATHVFPDPLHRLWRAHFGQVENPPSVIISLDDRYCIGWSFFARLVRIASTHGSLNYRNSVTFIMSTAGPLPPVMRSRDVPRHLSTLLGEPWPTGR